MKLESSFQNVLLETLLRFWGYEQFREQQQEIISSVLAGQDTLALLPTGGGKSLCYQLPALLQTGLTIVISPLLALMRDQVYDLISRGIPAVYLSSEFDTEQEDKIYYNLKNGDYKVLYVSPERLQNRKFLQNIEDVQVSLLAVDEAHCISEWGNDFRPSYQNIKFFRQKYQTVPCLALTATASIAVMAEIQKKLGLKNCQVFRRSFKRNNLFIEVKEVANKYEHILYYLRSTEKSGLIYVRTRRDAEDLSKWLQHSGIKNVDFYHAGLPANIKKEKQNYWLYHNFTLISTNAFGMGIDKSDVGFVIHLSPPPSLENYYQEIGRAGRDGNNAETILLWNESELEQIDDLLKNSMATKAEYSKITTTLYSLCKVAYYEEVDQFFEIQVQKIHKTTGLSRSKIVAVLRFLHNQEIIYLKEAKGKSSLELKISMDQLDLLNQNDGYFIEQLTRKLTGVVNHRVYFRQKNMEDKMGLNQESLRLNLRRLEEKGYLEYFDGASVGVRFLIPRDDKVLENKYWRIFSTIQKSRIQKWEEMKYFIRDQSFCKMRMILSYFGEKAKDNCGKCSFCKKGHLSNSGKEIKKQIFKNLMLGPMSLDEIAIRLKYYSKDEVLDELKELLDEDHVKMLNYKTYSL